MTVYRVYVKFRSIDIKDSQPKGHEFFVKGESERDAIRQIVDRIPARFAQLSIDHIENGTIVE